MARIKTAQLLQKKHNIIRDYEGFASGFATLEACTKAYETLAPYNYVTDEQLDAYWTILMNLVYEIEDHIGTDELEDQALQIASVLYEVMTTKEFVKTNIPRPDQEGFEEEFEKYKKECAE